MNESLEAQTMRMGQSPSGQIILTMDKNRIRRGNSPSGEIVRSIEKGIHLQEKYLPLLTAIKYEKEIHLQVPSLRQPMAEE